MEAKCAAAVFACALLAGTVTALALILAFREWGPESGHSNGRLKFTGDEDREINVLLLTDADDIGTSQSRCRLCNFHVNPVGSLGTAEHLNFTFYDAVVSSDPGAIKMRESVEGGEGRRGHDHRRRPWGRLIADPSELSSKWHKDMGEGGGNEFDFSVSFFPEAAVKISQGTFRKRRRRRGHQINEGDAAATALPRRKFPSPARVAAAIVDECQTQSNREGFIQELGQYMSVHTYGRCGSLPCPGDSTRDCLLSLNSRGYDFLLVLETHLCQDYQSDLLLQSLALTDLVPVVFGGIDYASLWPELGDGAPTVIDALQDHSPRALARYLRHLHQHPRLLARYRQWRDDYELIAEHWQCRLCRLLRTSTLPAREATPKRPLCTRWPSLDFGGG